MQTNKDLLSTDIQEILLEEGIFELFPVQEQVIPVLLHQNQPDHRDICVSAPTGSGKTLAYVLPIIQQMQERLIPVLRAICIVPSKDLVTQVRDTFKKFAQRTNLKIYASYGQSSFKEEAKVLVPEAKCSTVDILITTPARLEEHLKRNPNFDVSCLEFLVVDEADKIFSSPFQWYSLLLDRIKNQKNELATRYDPLLQFRFPQEFCISLKRLLFSATLTRNEAKLMSLQLQNPLSIHISKEKYTFPEGLQEFSHFCPEESKIPILLYLLQCSPYERILCFTSSNKSTERLSMLLGQFTDCPIGFFTGERTLQERVAAIQGFKLGAYKMLVCSDGISRGLDFEAVDCVVNFDSPSTLKTYVHRVGRTARANRTGTAISLVALKEANFFHQLFSDRRAAFQKLVLEDKPKLAQITAQVEQFLESSSVSKEEFQVKAFLQEQLSAECA